MFLSHVENIKTCERFTTCECCYDFAFHFPTECRLVNHLNWKCHHGSDELIKLCAESQRWVLAWSLLTRTRLTTRVAVAGIIHFITWRINYFIMKQTNQINPHTYSQYFTLKLLLTVTWGCAKLKPGLLMLWILNEIQLKSTNAHFCFCILENKEKLFIFLGNSHCWMYA